MQKYSDLSYKIENVKIKEQEIVRVKAKSDFQKFEIKEEKALGIIPQIASFSYKETRGEPMFKNSRLPIPIVKGRYLQIIGRFIGKTDGCFF